MNIETTDDWFLSDKLLLRQPKDGFRAGSDSLLLSAAVAAKPGQSTLDLGAGVGTVSLALAARVPNLSLALLELYAPNLALARVNLDRHKKLYQRAEVWCGDAGDAQALPPQRLFDHCFCNPPFFDPKGSRRNRLDATDLARRADLALDLWVKAMLRWTRSKGTMTMICRASSLDLVLAAFRRGAGGLTIAPVYPKPGKAAVNMIIRGVRDSRAETKILPGIVLRSDNGEILTPLLEISRFGNLKI